MTQLVTLPGFFNIVGGEINALGAGVIRWNEKFCRNIVQSTTVLNITQEFFKLNTNFQVGSESNRALVSGLLRWLSPYSI